MSICIIPARGGSRRIPRKNIRDFFGRPMISWPIVAAIKSACFDRVVVSTDDDEIANVANGYGAEVPFRRRLELSDDYTPIVPVVADAIKRLKLEGEVPVCCLFATAPFVNPDDLRSGLELLKKTDASYVISVTTYAFPIQRALRRTISGNIEMLEPQQILARSQDLEETWHDAGQFYWGKAVNWSKGKHILSNDSQGLPIPRYRAQDIDEQEDWERAELIMSALYNRDSSD